VLVVDYVKTVKYSVKLYRETHSFSFLTTTKMSDGDVKVTVVWKNCDFDMNLFNMDLENENRQNAGFCSVQS